MFEFLKKYFQFTLVTLQSAALFTILSFALRKWKLYHISSVPLIFYVTTCGDTYLPHLPLKKTIFPRHMKCCKVCFLNFLNPLHFLEFMVLSGSRFVWGSSQNKILGNSLDYTNSSYLLCTSVSVQVNNYEIVVDFFFMSA